jgi:predicted metal-binding membrane protein
MTRFSGRIILLPVQVAGYLAAWTIAGLAVHALYQPHTAPVAGALTLLAGAYELTPIKRRFREMTHQDAGSGWKLGFCCIGSSGGLMLVMLALGPMSITWMAVVGAVVLLQKVFRPWTPLDVGVAAAITILGLAALIVPSSVPGLVPPM